MNQKKHLNSVNALFKSLFSEIEKYKLAGMVLPLAVGQALYIFLPIALGLIVDGVFITRNLKIEWLLLFPALWGLAYVFFAISRFFTSIITQDVRNLSKASIFQYLIELPNSVYINRGAGKVESLMQEVSFTSRYLFSESLPFFIRVFTSLLTSFLILFYSSPWLGLLFMLWSILYIPVSYLISKRSVHHVSHSLISSTNVSAWTVDVIENHELIPAFGTSNYEIANFKKLLGQEKDAYLHAQQSLDRADLWQQLLQLLLVFGMILFVILKPGNIATSTADMVALFTMMLIVTSQIRDFGRGLLASFEIKERMKTALSQLSLFQDPLRQDASTSKKTPSSYSIQFTQVCFDYGAKQALRDITFSIKENEKIGIVGYSGAGKSTLIRLLKKGYQARSGTITLGSLPLQEIEPKFLTETISEVSQTIPLFHRSIRENVAYGCPEVSDDKIWHILERAQLADYVKTLPDGLNTIIGVKGSKLSGGERARLAIARAFLKDSKIIILDEATASLDSESESLLQKGLEDLIKDRTVIAIAHRWSTLRSMDRILFLENGQIVADGAHEHLLHTNAAYKKMWEIQAQV